ncbi:MAG TPA: hypothetical protein VFS08_10150 [Gemmatimonadaceae bacterium]|nr:hypothetical protein [Gemmatimonadaceae bacterium]
MPQLPLIIWIAAAAVLALLLGLCAGTAYAVLRAPMRQRVARWPAWRLLVLLAAAALPWLVVWLAPIRIVVSVHGVWPLIGWLLMALLVFALLVLLPLAAILGGVVWWAARRRGREAPPAP